MSYMLPHLRNGYQVDQSIVTEEDRVVVIRFGHDWDPTCMKMDETLYSIADKVKNFTVIYLVDITEVPDFNKMYELYDPCTVMFFYRNKHIMIDLGTGNNNKINWALEDKQELIDILETVYRGARKALPLLNEMSNRIEWAMWANENAIISCAVLFVGSILAVLSNALTNEKPHKFWEIAAYAVAVSIVVFLIEYPRGKRRKGNTLQRQHQYVLTAFVSQLSVFGRNYFVRFVFYLFACVPCLFNLGSVMGGLSLLVTAFIYLIAAIAGEQWNPCEKITTREKSLTRARPPSMAPPRLTSAATQGDDGEDYENAPVPKNV